MAWLSAVAAALAEITHVRWAVFQVPFLMTYPRHSLAWLRYRFPPVGPVGAVAQAAPPAEPFSLMHAAGVKVRQKGRGKGWPACASCLLPSYTRLVGFSRHLTFP